MRRDGWRPAAAVLAAGVTCAGGFVVSTQFGLIAAFGLAVLGVVTAVAIVVAAVRHVRLSRRLLMWSVPATASSTSYRVLPDACTAFVAGLLHPEIYCSANLTGKLHSEEFAAVLLHERGHQHRRDPLRRTVLLPLRPLLRAAPGGRQWLARRMAAMEIAADRYALEHGASRGSLASSLFKVDPAGVHVAGFRSAVDLRLAALLGDEPGPDPRSVTTWLVAGVFGGTALCLAMVLTDATWMFWHCCP